MWSATFLAAAKSGQLRGDERADDGEDRADDQEWSGRVLIADVILEVVERGTVADRDVDQRDEAHQAKHDPGAVAQEILEIATNRSPHRRRQHPLFGGGEGEKEKTARE